MNQGPLIFLGAFLTLSASWFGLVMQPQLQFGRAVQATNVADTAILYPQARPGMAAQGADAYRSLGCVACHSQQIRQQDTKIEISLPGGSASPPEAVAAVLKMAPDSTPATQKTVTTTLRTALQSLGEHGIGAALEQLNLAGTNVTVITTPIGPDLAHTWGRRGSVVQDYLFDQPVMLGSQRIGPDLANVGLRQADVVTHLLRLYNPRILEKKSVMPPYRFLFQQRKITGAPSPEALKLPGEFAPPTGYEIVPTDQARQLVAYLLSLRADAVLFSTPMTFTPKPAADSTNAPAAATPQPIQ